MQAVMKMSEALLETIDLKKHYAVRSGVLSSIKGHIKAVDGISLSISKGETFGLVGESGCGKSTLGRLMLRLIEPTSGECVINGENIYSLKEEQLRKLRRDIQIIFQDPYASLNPKMTAGKIIGEPLKIYNTIPDRNKREERVKELLETVGLSRDHFGRFPHEFSGGQRQRISIARALALNPKLIVCDEAVSALDVSIRSQILNLLKDLQKEFNLTYIFISHDLSVVKYICDRIGVMYLGKIVEIAPSVDLFKNPSHPYTKALLSAIPEPNPKKIKDRVMLKGDIPNPINPPGGCTFHPRCIYALEKCKIDMPNLEQISEGHYVSCHLIDI
jgi:oligopeptide/dipeptide ABC transporter ATP-binding protein